MKEKIAYQLLQIVKKNYQEIAESFSVTRSKMIWPEVNKVTQEIKGGESVLDLACGNGRLLEVFKNKKIEYLGVDNNEVLIKLAKEKYSESFLVGDLLNLKFINNKFNYVFCLAALQHIPSQELRIKVLKQIMEKTEDNGKIIISNWNLWSGKHRKKIFKFYFRKIIGKNKMDFGDILFSWKNSEAEEVSKRYYHAFTKRELKNISKKAGLEIDKLYKDRYNYWLILKKEKSNLL